MLAYRKFVKKILIFQTKYLWLEFSDFHGAWNFDTSGLRISLNLNFGCWSLFFYVHGIFHAYEWIRSSIATWIWKICWKEEILYQRMKFCSIVGFAVFVQVGSGHWALGRTGISIPTFKFLPLIGQVGMWKKDFNLNLSYRRCYLFSFFTIFLNYLFNFGLSNIFKKFTKNQQFNFNGWTCVLRFALFKGNSSKIEFSLFK